MTKEILVLIILIACLPIELYWAIKLWKEYINAKDIENEEEDSIVRKLADNGENKTAVLWVWARCIGLLALLVGAIVLILIDIIIKAK